MTSDFAPEVAKYPRRVEGRFVITGYSYRIWFDCGLLVVLCCHLATENVMKLLFLAFGCAAARGRGLLCRAPQLVFSSLFVAKHFLELFFDSGRI